MNFKDTGLMAIAFLIPTIIMWLVFFTVIQYTEDQIIIFVTLGLSILVSGLAIFGFVASIKADESQNISKVSRE